MRTLWSTIVLSVWGTQCSLGKGVGAIGAQQHRPNRISQKSRVPLQAVVPCLALICRNQSPIYKYFWNTIICTPTHQDTKRILPGTSRWNPAGTRVPSAALVWLWGSPLNYKERIKLAFSYPSSKSNCVSLFSLTRAIYGIFFPLCSYRPDSLFAPVSAGAGFLLSGTPAPFSRPLPPGPALRSTVSSSLLCPVEVFSHLATQNLEKLLHLLEISHEPLVKLTREVDEKSVRAEHLGPWLLHGEHSINISRVIIIVKRSAWASESVTLKVNLIWMLPWPLAV